MVRLVVLVNCFVPIHKSPPCYEPVFVSCLFLCWWKHVWIRVSSVLSHASVNSHGWNVCTLSSFTPLLKVLMPRQREAAELSCCRLVTLVTVAVQQDPSILTPEAWLNSKPSELPWVTLASSCFFFSSLCRLSAPSSALRNSHRETHTNSNAAPHCGYALML